MRFFILSWSLYILFFIVLYKISENLRFLFSNLWDFISKPYFQVPLTKKMQLSNLFDFVRSNDHSFC